MDHCYNVVWADDEIDSLYENYHLKFESKGIFIVKFTNADSAIDHILKHPQFVDAIIVDAKFSIKGGPVEETSNKTPGLSRFMHKIIAMRAETGMPLPCWIFTGYGDQLRTRYNEDDLEPFEDVISKSSNYLAIEEWLDEMCSRIRETQNEDYQLRQANADLFAMCTKNYLGEDKATFLMDIIKFDENKGGVPPFHPIRMLLESTLNLLQNRGVIQGTFSPTANGEKAKWLRENNWVNKTAMKMPGFVIDSFIMLAHNSSMSHPENKEIPSNYDSHEFYGKRAPYMFPLMFNALRTILTWTKYYLDSKPEPFVSQYALSKQEEAAQASTEGDSEIVEKAIPEGFCKAELTQTKFKFRLENGENAIYYPKKVNSDTTIGDTFPVFRNGTPISAVC